ncbi:MAG: hypothetical protein V7782_08520 [Psychromonas sp.]
MFINNPELLLLALNVSVLVLIFCYVYPKYCGANINKLLSNDVIATTTILVISGSLFWGTGQVFNLLIMSVNWFWFSLISYLIMEIPFALYYMKKYKIQWPDKK